MRDPNCVILFGQGRSRSVSRTSKPRFFCSSWLRLCNKQGIVREAQGSIWGSSWCTENVRSPCQQMAARLLLLIKFGPLIDPRGSISADKFLPGVHIKWIFLLRGHIFLIVFLSIFILSEFYLTNHFIQWGMWFMVGLQPNSVSPRDFCIALAF